SGTRRSSGSSTQTMVPRGIGRVVQTPWPTAVEMKRSSRPGIIIRQPLQTRSSHHHLARQWAQAVLARHAGAVRAGREEGEQVALVDFGERPVASEDIDSLVDVACDVVAAHGRSEGSPDVDDLVWYTVVRRIPVHVLARVEPEPGLAPARLDGIHLGN